MFLINFSLKCSVVYLLIVGVDSQGPLAANYTMALLQKCIYRAYSFDSFVTEKKTPESAFGKHRYHIHQFVYLWTHTKSTMQCNVKLLSLQLQGKLRTPDACYDAHMWKNYQQGFSLVHVYVCVCVLNRCCHYQACPQISQQCALLSKCSRCFFTGHPERSRSLMANMTRIQTHTETDVTTRSGPLLSFLHLYPRNISSVVEPPVKVCKDSGWHKRHA